MVSELLYLAKLQRENSFDFLRFFFIFNGNNAKLSTQDFSVKSLSCQFAGPFPNWISQKRVRAEGKAIFILLFESFPFCDPFLCLISLFLIFFVCVSWWNSLSHAWFYYPYVSELQSRLKTGKKRFFYKIRQQPDFFQESRQLVSCLFFLFKNPFLSCFLQGKYLPG